MDQYNITHIAKFTFAKTHIHQHAFTNTTRGTLETINEITFKMISYQCHPPFLHPRALDLKSWRPSQQRFSSETDGLLEVIQGLLCCIHMTMSLRGKKDHPSNNKACGKVGRLCRLHSKFLIYLHKMSSHFNPSIFSNDFELEQL